MQLAFTSPVPLPKRPALQSLQLPDMAPLLKRPVGHAAHGTAPPPENCPGAHTKVQLVWPVRLVYRPGGHAVQLGDLVALAKVPAGHAGHSDDPATLALPAGHGAHDVAFGAEEKNPALQLVPARTGMKHTQNNTGVCGGWLV